MINNLQNVEHIADDAHGSPRRKLFLTVTICGEEFAIDADQVQEVIEPLPVTFVPNAPATISGLINVRGAIVPVLNLRNRLGLPDTEIKERRFVVVEVLVNEESVKVALTVEGVNDVLNLADYPHEAVPDLGSRWQSEFVESIVTVGPNIIGVLNLDRISGLLD